jgi:hypothetical protein
MDPILLADIVVTVHLGFMLFVLIAQILIVVGWVLRWAWVRNFWFRFIHLASIGLVAGEALGKIECPLTTLERHLRKQEIYPRISAVLAVNLVGSGSVNVLATINESACIFEHECRDCLGEPYLHNLENASEIGRFCNHTLFFAPTPELLRALLISYVTFALLVVVTWLFIPPRLPFRKVDRPVQPVPGAS